MEIPYYRNKADKALQEKNRKEKPFCEHCKKLSQVGHHFFPKSTASALRYDMENIISLCNGCHFAHHNGDPRIHAKVMEERGIGWYKELERKKLAVTKISKGYYLKVLEDLTK